MNFVAQQRGRDGVKIGFVDFQNREGFVALHCKVLKETFPRPAWTGSDLEGRASSERAKRVIPENIAVCGRTMLLYHERRFFFETSAGT